MRYLLGLVGHPVSHSLSPLMHKAALAHYGLDGDYKLIDLRPEMLGKGIEKLVADRYTGFNVTLPHKRTVAALAGELTAEGKLLGAVNTVRINQSGVLVGHNTDLAGFLMALSDAWTKGFPGELAVVMGAGGAARAAVWALVNLGWSRISVVSRISQTAKSLADEVSRLLASQEPRKENVIVDAPAVATVRKPVPDLVVNCTPVGLGDDIVPDWMAQQLAGLASEGLFYDMVYRRDEIGTPLVKMARALNLAASDGSGMLVHQAALAFNFWTGKAGPVDVMRAAIAR
jgi:shikimate dehydrogenase